MSLDYSELREKSRSLQSLHKPEFFRLANADDRKRFDELLAGGTVFLYDEIYDQLKELIKSRNPAMVPGQDDLKRLIDEHLNGRSMDEYAVWVYYPWAQRVVHILDEDEFIELRTSANKNKITTAERNILAGKKVGVIGLSVGQSVSVTLAMERGCGELRLADFDTLELNNLNRIRTGVHNLGLLKAHSVAREIAEFDPYFKVVCYTDGITDGNIDDFFLKDGKLDAVIDECDGINIKILCRIKAREFNVPVLMEASDRGTLDVERFDLNPGMPIMHGWLEHLTLDLDVLKNLKTNEEKVPYILPISGLETLSARMQASMIEMRNTLTTWPQLASAVALGGALTADTCRRIFLNQFTDSGRYFIDLELLVPDTRAKDHFVQEAVSEPVTMGWMNEVATEALETLVPAETLLDESDINYLVSAAITAPSAGNSQPWKWHFSGGYLFLFYEYTDIISFGDFKQIASHISFGAALENLELAACSKGVGCEVKLFPDAQHKNLVAAVRFTQTPNQANLHKADELVRYIDRRVTNRGKGNRAPLAKNIVEQLEEAVASVPGARLALTKEKSKIDALANVIGPAERLKLLNPASHHEFYEKVIRWNEQECNSKMDGISIESMGVSESEKILLKMAKKPEVADLLSKWGGGQALEYISRTALGNASAVGWITMPDASPESYINGGRATERMWLTATKYDLAVYPMMAPVLFFARLKRGEGSGIPSFMKDELERLYAKFESITERAGSQEHIFLFKLSISDNEVTRSSRKPVGKILSFA